MEKVDVVRLEKSDGATFGVLRMDGEVFCVTLEPPDRGNRVGESCIPAGTYDCRRVESPSFGPTFEITDVPGRSHILFHQGNLAGDTEGCVLLGRNYGVLGGERGVTQSRPAFREFLSRFNGRDSFRLEVSESC